MPKYRRHERQRGQLENLFRCVPLRDGTFNTASATMALPRGDGAGHGRLRVGDCQLHSRVGHCLVRGRLIWRSGSRTPAPAAAQHSARHSRRRTRSLALQSGLGPAGTTSRSGACSAVACARGCGPAQMDRPTDPDCLDVADPSPQPSERRPSPTTSHCRANHEAVCTEIGFQEKR